MSAVTPAAALRLDDVRAAARALGTLPPEDGDDQVRVACGNIEHLALGRTVLARRHPRGYEAVEWEVSCECTVDDVRDYFARLAAEADELHELAAASSNGNGAAAAAPIGPALRLLRAADVRIEPVEYVIEERIARRAAAILAGNPGLGKSSLTVKWAADVTTGRHGGPAANVLLANGEDSRSVTAARLQAAGADMSRVYFFTVEDGDGERGAVLPDDVPLIEARAREVGDVALIVIDPLNAHLADEVSSHRDHSIRRAIAPAAAMAERLNCALVFVAHLNKAMSGDALYRVGGSIGLVGGVRSVLLFTSDPDDPEGDGGPRRCLGHVKSNWGSKAPTLIYQHVPVVFEVEGRRIETHRLEEVGTSDVPGEQLLGVDPDDPPATKRERAVELLADHLAGKDWTRASEIEELASRAGIGRRTLYSAADEVGVERDRRGFPAVAWWRLDSRAGTDCTTVVQDGAHNSAKPSVEPNPPGSEGQSCKPTDHAQQGYLRPVPDADDGTCRCRRPARSPRASGDDECAVCRRPIREAGGAA